MPKGARAYVGFARRVSDFLGGAAVLLLCLSVLLIMQVIIYRYALHRSTIWQTDAVVFFIVAATFIGSPYVLLKRGHINVDVLATLTNERGRWWLELVGSLLSLLFCIVLLYYSAVWWYDALESGKTTASIVRIPLWLPYLSMPIGMAGLVLQYVANLLEHVYQHREPNYDQEPAAVDAARGPG